MPRSSSSVTLGSGINLGNALDALDGHEHALQLRRRYFDEIKAAGFDTVRLPVAWSAHAEQTAPYAIGQDFFQRVDRAVDEALARDLNVVLNMHHYHELNHTPDEQTERFLALWRQIATRYAAHPDLLHFELLNEPRAAMTAQRWNTLLPHALAAVRESNPERTVLIGAAEMNDIHALAKLELPDDDHLVATVHYYAPFEFTHQGASWVEGAASWLGTTWGGEADRKAVDDDLGVAAAWADAHGVPLFIGEFGAYEQADMDSRARWTACVREKAELLGIGWAYWEFGTDFSAYARETDTWREPLRQALIPTM
ncbi:glycoside hydrolase family 5 protein [Streptomyces sp. NPDC050704]|uniref:glycoside hydrolase family 5 protein n=1 Tax=Streptomyces sp. NPDC050704 TaxID=3157219 RepID=UPI003425E1FE